MVPCLKKATKHRDYPENKLPYTSVTVNVDLD